MFISALNKISIKVLGLNNVQTELNILVKIFKNIMEGFKIRNISVILLISAIKIIIFPIDLQGLLSYIVIIFTKCD